MCFFFSSNLQLTGVDDGGLDVGADGTGVAAESLDLLDDLEGSVVSDLTEDDVLAVEPRGHNGGDEELGAVAVNWLVYCNPSYLRVNLRVGTSVGHGEDTGLGVLEDEVLIGELLTVDGATTGTLAGISDVFHSTEPENLRCRG